MNGTAGTPSEQVAAPPHPDDLVGPPPAADPFARRRDVIGEADRRLTVFEEALLVSNRPGQPKVVAFLARTDGSVDESRLRAAVATVLAHQPLARARLAPVRGTSLRWQFPPRTDVDPVSVVTCHDESGLDRAFESLCSLPVDLAVSPPVRVRLVRLPGGDAVALAAQHVASDGVGALAMLRGVVLAYGGSAPDQPNRRTGSRAEQPADQAEPLPGRRSTPSAIVRAVVGLARTRPARIAGASARPGPGYGVQRVSLPVEPLAAAAKACEVTVNDLLLAALHSTIERWNAGRGHGAKTVQTRLPVDRRPADRRWDIGNVTAQAVVTTTGAERVSPDRLTAAVAAQTRRFKAQPLSGGPAGNLGALGALPVRLRIPLQRAAIALVRPYLMPTGELPNVGRLDTSWSLGPDGPSITALHFAAFTGMPQGLSLAAVGYRGRVNLTVGYRWALLDHAGAAEFARIYQEELAALAA